MKEKKVLIPVGVRMEGEAQCFVLEKGRVVRSLAPKKNLILNAGMNQAAASNGPFALLASVAVAGTGTTPTTDDSGTTTMTRAGTTVTLLGGTFVFTNTGTDAGKYIKADSGEIMRIVTVTSPTIVVVDVSGVIAATEFTTYRTNQTGLATEVVRTNTYLTGSGNCGSTYTGNSLAHKRTFDFPSESGSVSYTELGFSQTASSGNNLFSRILLGSAVPLTAGQQLRVIYTLTMVWEPDTPLTVAVEPITGWTNATGVCQIQVNYVSAVDTSGNISFTGNFGTIFEPTTNADAFTGFTTVTSLYSGNTAHNAFDTAGPSRSEILSKQAVRQAYAADSYFRDIATTFAVGEANSAVIRTLGLCKQGGANQGFIYIMDADQTKDSLHTLTITWRVSWTRTFA